MCKGNLIGWFYVKNVALKGKPVPCYGRQQATTKLVNNRDFLTNNWYKQYNNNFISIWWKVILKD